MYKSVCVCVCATVHMVECASARECFART